MADDTIAELAPPTRPEYYIVSKHGNPTGTLKKGGFFPS